MYDLTDVKTVGTMTDEELYRELDTISRQPGWTSPGSASSPTMLELIDRAKLVRDELALR